jgi:hypothetical protein
LKRRSKGLSIFNENQFDALEELSSIEGSDSDEDDNLEQGKREDGSPFANFIYYEGGIKKELMVYKQVLHSKTKENVDYLQQLRELQLKGSEENLYWSLFLLSSGHFVGAVIDIRTGKPIASKSFHRYTTRRKQGGAQSSNDKSKGKAKSAGAGIRRYNEQALKEEIQNLLLNWKGLIEKSTLIFARAPAGLRSMLLSDISPAGSNGMRKLI